MQSILRWSIENSATNADNVPPTSIRALDPGIIDHILGKPDSEQMKSDVATAIDLRKSEEERVEALDHLEMLVEQIDNANDLERLKLWEPLHSLLTGATPSSQNVKSQALWAIGTAVQNNPAAQDAYLAYDPLPVLLSFLDPDLSPWGTTRSKAIYVLSGLLRHNAPALAAFGNGNNGWPKLRDSLQDPNIAVRRKVIFLLGTLLLPATISTTTTTTMEEGGGGPNLLTPDNRPTDAAQESSSGGNTIYPNSHAEYLRDPSRLATSQPVLDAIREHDIFDAVCASLRDPVPHGDDGEHVGLDVDYGEKAVRFVYLYVAKCPTRQWLTEVQRESVLSWVVEATREGNTALPDNLGLAEEEYEELVRCLRRGMM